MKNMNWKSIALLIAAIPIITLVAGQFGRNAAERVNAREAGAARPAASQELQVLVSSQDAEGTTQEQMNLDFLTNLEAYTVERVKVNAKKYLVSIGQPNVPIDVTSEATYVESGPVKLAVIRLLASGSRQVIVSGLVGREFKRVACIRASAESVPLSYGPCGDKVREVFGVSIGSQPP